MKSLSKSEIVETLAIIKGVKSNKIINVDLTNNTFELGRSVFMFDLAKNGLVKTASVKYFATISSLNNCSY